MIDLHPQLAQDTRRIGHFPLCQLLILLDANYPWFILLPDREGITEIHQLSDEDQQQFIRESSLLASTLAELFKADKLNVAALGNVVPQLHIHHVVRYRHDPAWPAPVWGAVPRKSYAPDELDERIQQVMAALPVAGNTAFSPE